MESSKLLFLAMAGAVLLLLLAATHFSGPGSLNHIKSKTVGDGQYGTARWATPKEIRKTFHHVSFHPVRWRKGQDRPKDQGLILGSTGKKGISRPWWTATTSTA